MWQAFVPPGCRPSDDVLVDADELDALAGADESDDWRSGTACCRTRSWTRRRRGRWRTSRSRSRRTRLSELDADGTLAEAAGDQAGGAAGAGQAGDAGGALGGPARGPVAAVGDHPGCERLVRLGGDGTPEVAEFAPAELGAVLGMTRQRREEPDGGCVGSAAPVPAAVGSRCRAGSGGRCGWPAGPSSRPGACPQEAAAGWTPGSPGIAGSLTGGGCRAIVDAAILAADPPKAIDDAEQAAAEAGVFLDPEPNDGYQATVHQRRRRRRPASRTRRSI